MKASDIGTERAPIRASALYNLQMCPGFWWWRTIAPMLNLGAEQDDRTAADTGSAAGRAIQLWHEEDLDVESIMGRVESEVMSGTNAQAELARVGRVFTRYTEDPRNPRWAVERGSCEREIRMCVPMPGGGEPLVIVGHLDQVRRAQNGRLYVWDTKLSRKSAELLRQQYAWQLAAYAIGASEVFGEPVHPGGFIALNRYDEKRYEGQPVGAVPVFVEVTWDLDQARSWLDHAAYLVQALRMGALHTRPCEACTYCPRELPACETDYLTALESGRFTL